MRIGRFEADDEIRIGMFEDGTVTDITAEFDDFQDVLSGPGDVVAVDGETFDTGEITYLPPTTDQNTIFCTALNYEVYAEESDSTVAGAAARLYEAPRTLVGRCEPISYHTR